MSPTGRLHRPFAIQVAAVSLLPLLILVELLVILRLNAGLLSYSLDDAYIQLALGERILQGHFGIDLSQSSAPSSSILWPFLQLPFLAAGSGDFGPLILNTLAATLTLLVGYRLLYRALCPCQTVWQGGVLLAGVLLLIPLTNLVGLVFTGMEHSLQLLLASLVVLGLVEESRDGRVRWWLWLAVVLEPLIRYESLALSLPALLYLLSRGHARPALASSAVLAALLAAYSLFLRSLGLSLLANSLVAKSAVLWYGNKAEAVWRNLLANLGTAEGLLLLALLILSLWAAGQSARPSAERRLAAVVAICLGLHLLLGTIDGYHRYELYAWTAGSLALVYLFRDRLRRLVQGERVYLTGLALLVLIAVAGRQYAPPLLTTPLGANDIYRQQYQMHRFVTEFYQGPVAVVDLGRVAYKNDWPVLDLWGLASPEALAYRRSGAGSDWLNDLAERYDVRLAMIYDFRFRSLPPNWRPLGALHLGRTRLTVADDVVAFYALDEVIIEEVRPQLLAFQQSLPPGVTFRFAE